MTGAGTGADIRDIAGPVPVPDPLAWLLPAAAVVAIVALALLAFRLWRRRAARAATPEARARARIEAARGLMTPERARDYGAALSDAVRRYLEERFGEQAPRRTTEEFLHEIATRTTSPLRARASVLESFLGLCDLAKFARRPLTPGEMEALRGRALSLVEGGEGTA